MSEGRVQVEAQPRAVLGKKVRFLRREGWVPGNLFGRGAHSTAIQVRTREMEHLLAHTPRNALLSLQIDGGSPATVLIRGVARKPTTGEIYHVDFYKVSMTQRLRTDVPIVLVGTAPAADLHGATILQAMDALHVECLPGNLPTRIVVDIERLAAIDDAVHVRDLELPPGVVALVDDEELVAKALAPTLEAEVTPEAVEAAAPTEGAGDHPAEAAEK